MFLNSFHVPFSIDVYCQDRIFIGLHHNISFFLGGGQKSSKLSVFPLISVYLFR